MVKKTDLVRAAHVIEKALAKLVDAEDADKIHVYESTPGHLRAVVGSDVFKSVGVAERQELVWKHLKSEVNEKQLRYCWGVRPLDIEEYYIEHFPQYPPSLSAFPIIED